MYNKELLKEFCNEMETTIIEKKEPINICKYQHGEFTRNSDDCYLLMNMEILEKQYNSLPESIRNLLESTNLKMYIIDYLEHSGDYNNKKNIAIFNNNSMGIDIHHEIGHALDYALNKDSDNDIWKTIYENNKDKVSLFIKKPLLLNHLTSNKEEFFAFIFDNYISNNEKLLKEIPEAYEYMNQLVLNIEGQKKL